MKTINDFKALLPILIEKFSNLNHGIGESYFDRDEDGWGQVNEYETNYFRYEEDGWEIEIEYECCGEYLYDNGDEWTPSGCDLMKAWGNVNYISVSHYDEATEEVSDFTDDELNEFYEPFNEVLKKIA
ncbi:MAG: hypothetical protein K2M59_03760 [Muribaculaceae bacterium]|nr:hypothetical protein [Muribaculaceae bacterium]MDE7465526.1 hypothetical protein [Muribaculaceae bacterium]